MADDLDRWLTSYWFPEAHWVRLRTTNPFESVFASVRLRTNAAIPHWSPNQLRHNAATRLRKAFGLDVAQIVLGHSRADATEIYAEADLRRAAPAMAKVG